MGWFSSERNVCTNGIGRYVHNELVTISVGREKKKYTVYKALLTVKSHWFAARLNGRWQCEPIEIEMEDESTDTFDWILGYMFGCEVGCIDNPGFRAFLYRMAPVYKLADKLLMTSLKNEIIDLVLEMMTEGKKASSFKDVFSLWELDLSSTELYRLALRDSVRYFVPRPSQFHLARPSMMSLYAEPDPVKQVFECIQEYNAIPWNQPSKEGGCEYPDHSDRSSCSS